MVNNINMIWYIKNILFFDARPWTHPVNKVGYTNCFKHLEVLGQTFKMNLVLLTRLKDTSRHVNFNKHINICTRPINIIDHINV